MSMNSHNTIANNTNKIKRKHFNLECPRHSTNKIMENIIISNGKRRHLHKSEITAIPSKRVLI